MPIVFMVTKILVQLEGNKVAMIIALDQIKMLKTVTHKAIVENPAITVHLVMQWIKT